MVTDKETSEQILNVILIYFTTVPNSTTYNLVVKIFSFKTNNNYYTTGKVSKTPLH